MARLWHTGTTHMTSVSSWVGFVLLILAPLALTSCGSSASPKPTATTHSSARSCPPTYLWYGESTSPEPLPLNRCPSGFIQVSLTQQMIVGENLYILDDPDTFSPPRVTLDGGALMQSPTAGTVPSQWVSQFTPERSVLALFTAERDGTADVFLTSTTPSLSTPPPSPNLPVRVLRIAVE